MVFGMVGSLSEVSCANAHTVNTAGDGDDFGSSTEGP